MTLCQVQLDNFIKLCLVSVLVSQCPGRHTQLCMNIKCGEGVGNLQDGGVPQGQPQGELLPTMGLTWRGKEAVTRSLRGTTH